MILHGAKYGDRCEEGAIDAWLSIIDTFSKLDNSIDKITQINQLWNNYIYYYNDSIVDDDYIWISPLHCLTLESGDSNNIAMLKMITLLEMGFSEEQVRIYQVTAITDGDEFVHSVLGIHLDDADPLILDVLTNDITPLSSRTELTPIFAFNKKNVWIDNQLTDNDAKTYVPAWGICVDLINEELY